MSTQAMSESSELVDDGLEVLDLRTNQPFTARVTRPRDEDPHINGMRRLAHAFVESPDSVLQELTEAAIDLCGAESAGISMQETDAQGKVTYRWVATAGTYAPFLDAILPASPSACALCLERGRPQLFRVRPRFFEKLQVQAEPVKDGVLIPWAAGLLRGTIWIISHTRDEAFDAPDVKTMELLADFAAMAVRQQTERKLLLEQATAAAVTAMANDLAHHINNPLQGLTNLVYLAAEGTNPDDLRTLAREMSADLSRLSALVNRLLALPIQAERLVSR